jgi:proliferating cell nuclear antigen
MVMEAEFKDAEVFKKMMDTIGSLMSDVSIDFNEEGFAIKAMDPANIAMVLFEAKKSIFSSFNVEKPIKISVSLDDLNGILRLTKKEDRLKMSDSKNRLVIDINGKNKQHFGIPLIDENYTAQKIPQLKFTSEVTVLGSLIKDSVKAAVLVDDSIYFTVDRPRFIISSKSEEKEFSQELSINDNKEIFDMKSDSTTRSKYSIDYLTKFLYAVDPEKPVRMSFSNNYPLKLDYEINSDASMSFILANRLE